jgi:hypothetical protein
MPGALQVALVYNKANESTLGAAAKLFAEALPVAARATEGTRIAPVKVYDSREPPTICDICIHFDTPFPVWFPWARTNVLVIATEWCDAWKELCSSFDSCIFRDLATFDAKSALFEASAHCPWSSTTKKTDIEYQAPLIQLVHTLNDAMEHREPLPRHMPPLLNTGDCPPISIVTLVYNRPKFIENAMLNLLHTDYPRDKLEWIVVDDSDPDQSASHRIIQFEAKFSPGKVVYVPLPKKTSVGAKRNLAVERASHDICLMMDDDDHYPITSFRRRVAWLLKAKKRYECAMCTTIAMYDLQKGTSAVNVPPYDIPFSQRCSEATLTFTKSFWKQRPFPDVSVAEGDGFLTGRTSSIVEMPPQQIIVALSHGTNLSSRTVPTAQVSCFWGFQKPLLEFLHGLVGVKVEDASKS